MNTVTAQAATGTHPVIMFIDDEQRVLKSMRAMFRRDYEVLLANSGAQALQLLESHDVEVVVSDQRMPEMTGVEVLAQIKERSPDTVRILLTGYADLAAVEASINEAEVFKYLMKPCPAEEVRGAVQAALDLRGEGVSTKPSGVEGIVYVADDEQPVSNVTPINAKSKAVVKAHQSPAAPPAAAVDILVFSNDSVLFDGVAAASPNHRVRQAKSLSQVLDLIAQHPIGVLVTDVGVDEKGVAQLSHAVRQLTPEIVIILASERSDANLLIQLINSGQVFRFLLKPLQAGQCKIWLASAMRRFLDSGGQALAALDYVVTKPSAWVRFKHWLLGTQA
ncbi:MAG: response regulator [bacterium]